MVPAHFEIAAFLLTASEATAEKHYDGEHQQQRGHFAYRFCWLEYDKFPLSKRDRWLAHLFLLVDRLKNGWHGGSMQATLLAS